MSLDIAYTGYREPEGMVLPDDKWDRRYLQLAQLVSSWSKDPSTQCGAVVVDTRNRVAGTGYNGFPAGCDDDPLIYADRPRKYKRVVHAEVNAILDAGRRAEGAMLYVYPSFAIPNICCECCKIAIQAGIVEIVGYEPKEIVERWKESIGEAKQMCDEAGVSYRMII